MIVKKLTSTDTYQMMEVEKKAFIPPLQASKEKILYRLEKNHPYLGLYDSEKIVGTIAFRYGRFSPQFPSGIPRTADMYANLPNEKDPNVIFCYSLGIIPSYRQMSNALLLINSMLSTAKKNHPKLEYLLGEGRFPSYKGSMDYDQEKISHRQKCTVTIDKCLKENRPLTRGEMREDPLLAFYQKFVRMLPFELIPHFSSGDHPSGGHRLMMYRKL